MSTRGGVFRPRYIAPPPVQDPNLLSRTQGIVNANVNLVGVGATGALGNFLPTLLIGFSGESANGSAGEIGRDQSGGLTGVGATAAVGSFLSVLEEGVLTGIQASGTVGSFAVSDTFAIVGVSAGAQAGNLQATGDIFYGVQANGSVGNFVTSNVGALVGSEAVGQVGTLGEPLVIPTFTGLTATGQVGTLGAVQAFTFDGTEAIGHIGDFYTSITPDVGVVLGVEAISGVGSLNPTDKPSLAGLAAIGQAGSLSKIIIPSLLTGVRGTGVVGQIATGPILPSAVGTGLAGYITLLGTRKFMRRLQIFYH